MEKRRSQKFILEKNSFFSLRSFTLAKNLKAKIRKIVSTVDIKSFEKESKQHELKVTT